VLEKFRRYANVTREEAAFRLHVAVRTLYSYEKGHQLPPADVICGMAEIYNNSSIPLWYCANICPIGMQYGCPETKETAPYDGAA